MGKLSTIDPSMMQQMPQDMNQIQQAGAFDPSMMQMQSPMGAEAMPQQMDPEQAMMMQQMQEQQMMAQQQPPDPLIQAIQATLNVYMMNASEERTKELNAEVQAKVLKTTAETLNILYQMAQPPEQTEQIPAELQFEMEQRKLEAGLQIEQARFQIEQQKAHFEMEIRQMEMQQKFEMAQAEGALKLKIMQEQADITNENLLHKADLEQEKQQATLAFEEQKLSIQADAAKSKAQQANKGKS